MNTRITVTVDQPVYERLRELARSKRLSLSWLVRDALEAYVVADIPLLAPRKKSPESEK